MKWLAYKAGGRRESWGNWVVECWDMGGYCWARYIILAGSIEDAKRVGKEMRRQEKIRQRYAA